MPARTRGSSVGNRPFPSEFFPSSVLGQLAHPSGYGVQASKVKPVFPMFYEETGMEDCVLKALLADFDSRRALTRQGD